MAKIVSTLFIALDGVVEVNESWHFPYFSDQMGAAVDDDYAPADLLLLGRVTYDSFAGAWPDREAAGEQDAAFAARLGDVRKVVVSQAPLEFSWRNSEQLDGDLVSAVTELKADPDVRHILIPGSISVVRQLLAAGLIDELRLLVHPVAARSGKRLFDEGDTIYPMTLLRSETFATGVLRLIYAPGELPGIATYDEVKDKVRGASN